MMELSSSIRCSIKSRIVLSSEYASVRMKLRSYNRRKDEETGKKESFNGQS